MKQTSIAIIIIITRTDATTAKPQNQSLPNPLTQKTQNPPTIIQTTITITTLTPTPTSAENAFRRILPLPNWRRSIPRLTDPAPTPVVITTKVLIIPKMEMTRSRLYQIMKTRLVTTPLQVVVAQMDLRNHLTFLVVYVS